MAGKVPSAEKRHAGKKTASKQPSTPFSRRNRRKRTETFTLYIFKLLKQICVTTRENMGMNKKAMSIVNSFINDIFDRIATEATRLMRLNKKRTLSSREIQTSVKLLIPGELGKTAVSEGRQAVNKYNNINDEDKDGYP